MHYLLLLKHELAATLAIVVLLVARLGRNRETSFYIHLGYLLLLLHVFVSLFPSPEGQLFAGLFVNSPLLGLQKSFLAFGLLLIALTADRWLRQHEYVPEVFLLMISSLLGLFLLISSGSLLMFYLALELATLPIAALCNFDLRRQQSSEAATKMILSSAFSSAILSFGISLLYGSTGSLRFPDIAQRLSGSDPLHVIALVLLFSGFAFKLSVVPFHLWTADVYQGSPVPVTTYLSVVSKGAIVFIFCTALFQVFAPLQSFGRLLLIITAVATLLIGNLFALRQENLKRFLAFSSIAQVGFILVALSGGTKEAVSAAVYFVLVYLFSNVGAFAVVGIVSAATGKETITELRGLYHSNRLLSWVLALSLFSLAGIPPTAGFFGKFFLLMAGAHSSQYALIAFAALNMVVALFYYLRVVRAIFLEPPFEGVQSLNLSTAERLALALSVAGILISGIYSGAYEAIAALI
ncbi:MAG: NADH-quinone oxidoreductase subunit N [Chitinophagales bacterium]|nr:NADH-quinone oxidoreductase subunit N [Chitinophagales bacterium]MDW8427631.1 NADH-quinone oxidoreductase subunit N [Chitinophagales bacterium]